MGYFDVLNLSGGKYEKLSVKFMCCITDKRNSYLSVKQFHPARWTHPRYEVTAFAFGSTGGL
jgi:hypothetical protein